MTEDHGVRGSTPRRPILRKVYKNKFVKYNMAEKRGVAFILGILSIVFAFFQPLVGLILGIIGLVQNKQDKSKKAKKLNIIGIVLSIIVFIGLMILNIYMVSQQAFPY